MNCKACNKLSSTVYRCFECESSYYCSKECYINDLPKHRLECCKSEKYRNKISNIVSNEILLFTISNMKNMIPAKDEYFIKVECQLKEKDSHALFYIDSLSRNEVDKIKLGYNISKEDIIVWILIEDQYIGLNNSVIIGGKCIDNTKFTDTLHVELKESIKAITSGSVLTKKGALKINLI